MNAHVSLTEDQFRASVVGASEVAALFDCHPWLTKFELWHRKNGTMAVPDFNAVDENGVPENERIYWGVRLEGPIIEAAKERWGYIDRADIPRLHNGHGLGGHPDKRVTCPDRGDGILEVKMVDWLEVKKWEGEPPLHYLLQEQTYMGLDKVQWGDFAVLVGGNKLERFQFEFRPKLFAEIEDRVDKFWKSIKAGKPPKPEYSRDRAALGEIYSAAGETTIDLRHDNRMMHLAAEYVDAVEHHRAAEARVKMLQAEILDKVRENTFAMVDGFSVKVPMIAGSPDKIITADMVGKTQKGRSAHRRFYITEITA